MGKREKKPKHQQRSRRRGAFPDDVDGSDEIEYYEQQSKNVSAGDNEDDDDDNNQEEEAGKKGEVEKEEIDKHLSSDLPSKFLLYQQSVQSPKGDISYLKKFFLKYVGRREPLHLQEDFCGTALLSVEWLRADPRRTAIGLDMDLEALEWCMENNVSKVGADGYSRISLFHGNVLSPLEAKLVKPQPEELMENIRLGNGDDENLGDMRNGSLEKECYDALPKRDIICAFNYSCCCLHKRTELVSYFKNAHDALSKRGGIFVMDIYGGTSAEGQLKLKRRFQNFTYTWEQFEFDIIGNKTQISLHYNLAKQNRQIRHAFSYKWRLWTLPEIKDCLEEAGFHFIHFWLKKMPEASEMRRTEGFGTGHDQGYEEVKKFPQCDAWNAYIVAVAI